MARNSNPFRKDARRERALFDRFARLGVGWILKQRRERIDAESRLPRAEIEARKDREQTRLLKGFMIVVLVMVALAFVWLAKVLIQR
jgi:hypothetical protein